MHSKLVVLKGNDKESAMQRQNLAAQMQPLYQRYADIQRKKKKFETEGIYLLSKPLAPEKAEQIQSKLSNLEQKRRNAITQVRRYQNKVEKEKNKDLKQHFEYLLTKFITEWNLIDQEIKILRLRLKNISI